MMVWDDLTPTGAGAGLYKEACDILEAKINHEIYQTFKVMLRTNVALTINMTRYVDFWSYVKGE